MFGKPNGKTNLFWQVWLELSLELEGIDAATRAPYRHAENYHVEILPNVSLTSAGLTKERVMRLIMQSYQVQSAAHMRQYEMLYRFKKLMIQLEKSRIIPCIAMDNIELMRPVGYSILKDLNELRYGGKATGIACLLAGEFSKRKMKDTNFMQHCNEFNIGKVTAAEMEEFISNIIGPYYAPRFKEAAVKQLLECQSTLEMARLVKRAFRDIKEGAIEVVTPSELHEYQKEESLSRVRIAA